VMNHDPAGVSLLMRTYTIVIPCAIAVKAEQDIVTLWKSVLTKPTIEDTTSTNLATMLSTIVIHMVDGKNCMSVLTATRASAAVGIKDFLTKMSAPDHDVGFLITLVANMLGPITIRAKQLESLLWKAVLTQPPIETMTSASATALISTIIVDMVNRKKCEVCFATLYALAAIGSKDLITKFISISLQLLMALLAKFSCESRPSKALGTHARLSFLYSTLTILRILTSTNLLLFFKRLSEKRFTLPLHDFLIVRKIIIMAARLAGNAETITYSMPILGSFRMIAATTGAVFLRGILGYNNVHEMGHSFSSRLGTAATSPGHHILLPQSYHRSAYEASLEVNYVTPLTTTTASMKG
jgi:hypothetical protein